jgi:hypothetical protein
MLKYDQASSTSHTSLDVTKYNFFAWLVLFASNIQGQSHGWIVSREKKFVMTITLKTLEATYE